MAKRKHKQGAIASAVSRLINTIALMFQIVTVGAVLVAALAFQGVISTNAFGSGSGVEKSDTYVLPASGTCGEDSFSLSSKIGGVKGRPTADDECDKREDGRMMLPDMPLQAAVNRCTLNSNLKVFGSAAACYYLNEDNVGEVITSFDSRYLEQISRCEGKSGWLKTQFRRQNRVERCMRKVAAEQRLRFSSS